ncbi:Protein kinase domain family protein [Candida albicans]|uniref:Protein kinase domain family protein n=1 Tax=Candida albicans TaxID=5476 RepID=A0A8H6C4I5_CANAX|nr:Protein kinase domain family protein [Candida albicans]
MTRTTRIDTQEATKHKDLPPVPSPLSLSSNPNPECLMESKSLGRKNFKKLSLDASPVKSTSGSLRSSDMMSIKEPTSLRQKRQRPPPILHLPTASSSATSTPTSNITGSSSASSIQFAQKSPGSGVIVSQTLSRPSSAGGIPSSGYSSLNVNQSNRNVDPDNVVSTDMILNQISNLDLTTSSQSPIATTSSLKLNNKDLLTLKQLGSGNSGSVSKILHIPTQKTMAKKIIHIDSKSVIQTQIIRELRILHECHSPYIIEFYGACLNNNNTIVICMEYCNCGSLDKILPLCENKQFPTFVLKKLSFAILSGLTYLYTTHKIIHRDIKPNNVLMTHKGEFKLCDFGVSRELTNSLAMADTFVGTSMYMSPERIQGLDYGVKSDVWSTGLMLIELASGVPVWSEDDNNNDDDEDDEDDAYVRQGSIAAERNGQNSPSRSRKNKQKGNGYNSYNGPEGILDLLQRIVNEDAPTLTNKINPVTKLPYDKYLCQFIDLCLIKDDSVRKTPWQLLEDKEHFFKGVEEGVYDKEHKSWAKKIRKCKV